MKNTESRRNGFLQLIPLFEAKFKENAKKGLIYLKSTV